MTYRQWRVAQKICDRLPKEQAEKLWMELRGATNEQAYQKLARHLPAKMPDDSIMEMDAGDHF